MKYCSKCGDFVSTGFIFGNAFCGGCGESTKTAIEFYCENGHSIGKYNEFCESCGAKKLIKKTNINENPSN